MISNSVQYRKATIYIKIIVLSFFLFTPSPCQETEFFYMPIQGTKREKYFNHIICAGKVPTLAGKKHPSVQFFLHGPRLFHLSTEKGRL